MATADTYEITAITCPADAFQCEKTAQTTLDFTGSGVAAVLCEPDPPMDDGDDCRADAGGGSGTSVGGEGPRNVAPAEGGPGALLRYTARGVGHPSYPGAAEWNPTLGRYWSHDYAQRIVVDPTVGDETHVWLLTKAGTFREFRNPDGAGVYQDAAPSDEYRTLTVLTDGVGAVTGWELRELDGTVHTFDDQGRWKESAARNGNTNNRIWAEFDDPGTGNLIEVHFPDRRTETFTYHSAGLQAGKLAAITEYGIGDPPTASRGWSYEWDADGDPQSLDRITRPDGMAWRFFYTDTRHPGYMTRMELVGDDGTSVRIMMGWTYDDSGNVVQTWKGDTVTGQGADAPGNDAVEVYELAFDDPAQPTQTIVKRYTSWPSTDPSDYDEITYELERDTVSRKPFVTSITGDCPVCGLGPNSTFVPCDGTDPSCSGHPLRVFQQVDGKGNLTQFEYDTQGQRTKKLEAVVNSVPFRTTEWAYDPNYPAYPTLIRQPSTSTGSFRETAMQYLGATGDLEWREIRGFEELDGEPPINFFADKTSFTYNVAGQVETIDPPGYGTADVTTWLYDESDRGGLVPTQRTDPVIGILGVTNFEHDAFNRRIRVTDPNGVATDTQYDGISDRVHRTIRRATGGGSPIDEPQVGDLVTEYAYDTWGNLYRTWSYRVESPPAAIVGITEYGYEPAPGPARLVRIEQKPDVSTPGQRTVYELDDLGNRIREELREADDTLKGLTEFVYEGGCQVAQIKRYPSVGGQPSTTEYGYDCNGNLERVWDANHPSSGQTSPATQFYEYDALNRLETVTQPEGGTHVTQYEYDVQDHLTKVTDAESNVTDYVYSDRDLLTLQDTHGVSGQTVFTYNEHGQLVTETDARGITVSRTVDALDRVTSIDYPTDQPPDTVFRYDDDPDEPGAVPDLIGRLAQIERGSSTVEYRYDRFGRTTQDGELTYGYDGRSNRTTITFGAGVSATYTYDEANRQKSLVVSGGGAPQTVVSTASYLPSGPLAGLTFGNGGTPLTETRGYDLRYFPTGIELVGAATQLDWTYTTDSVGNISEIVDNLDAANNRSFTYEPTHYYLDCAAGPWSPGSDCDPLTGQPYIWTYDGIGNRESETDLTGTFHDYLYASNGTGNSPVLDQIDPDPPGGIIYDYAYDVAGNLTQVDRSGNVIDFAYDDAGRLTSVERIAAGARVDLSYDGRSFLSRAGEPGAFLFAPVGDLIFEDDFESGDFSAWSSCVGGPGCGPPPPEGITPLYDSEGRLHRMTDQDGNSEYVFYFGGRPVAQMTPDIQDEIWTFLTTDHLGTPLVASDETGQAFWQGGFEPFGRDFADARGAGIFLRLSGQWWDPVWEDAVLGADLYYNVHRWYEYGTGRYTRVDPLRIVGPSDLTFSTRGLVHAYGYVNGRPLHSVDPLGLEATNNDRLNCFLNPIECRQVNDCRQQAYQATQARFGGQGRNDGSDAYRHCYWSCCMAQTIGAGDAQKWGDGHENYLGNPKCELVMDLFNNAQGRGSGPSGPSSSCADHCSTVPLQDSPGSECCPSDSYPLGADYAERGTTPRVVP